jgi:predicted O-methyltransferase YrrM
MVFIHHSNRHYLGDLKLLEKNKLLNNGAIVIADNVGFYKNEDYIKHVRNQSLYSQTTTFNTQLPYLLPDEISNPAYSDSLEVSVWRGII